MIRSACNTGPCIQGRTDSVRLFFSSRRTRQLPAPATVSPLISTCPGVVVKLVPAVESCLMAAWFSSIARPLFLVTRSH
jgi:hypothetical protein